MVALLWFAFLALTAAPADMRGEVVCGIPPTEAVAYAEYDELREFWTWIGPRGVLACLMAGPSHPHPTPQAANLEHRRAEPGAEYVCQVEVREGLWTTKTAHLYRLNRDFIEYGSTDPETGEVMDGEFDPRQNVLDAPKESPRELRRKARNRYEAKPSSRRRACSVSALVSLGLLYDVRSTPDNVNTVLFTRESLVETIFREGIGLRTWANYRVFGNSIGYTIAVALGTRAGLKTLRERDLNRDVPVSNAGPHTLSCAIIGDSVELDGILHEPR